MHLNYLCTANNTYLSNPQYPHKMKPSIMVLVGKVALTNALNIESLFIDRNTFSYYPQLCKKNYFVILTCNENELLCDVLKYYFHWKPIRNHSSIAWAVRVENISLKFFLFLYRIINFPSALNSLLVGDIRWFVCNVNINSHILI